MSSARCSCSPHANGRTPSETRRAKFDIGVRGVPEIRPSSPRTCRRAPSRVRVSARIQSRSRATFVDWPVAGPMWLSRLLRLANLMGAGVDSHVATSRSRWCRESWVSMRLQFLHPSDAVDALLLVTRRDVPEPSTWRRPMSSLSTRRSARWAGRPSASRGHCAFGCHAGTPGAAGGLLSRPDRRADLRSCHGHVPFHVSDRIRPEVHQPGGAGGVRRREQGWVAEPGAG